jgi:hypothetical protein
MLVRNTKARVKQAVNSIRSLSKSNNRVLNSVQQTKWNKCNNWWNNISCTKHVSLWHVVLRTVTWRNVLEQCTHVLCRTAPQHAFSNAISYWRVYSSTFAIKSCILIILIFPSRFYISARSTCRYRLWHTHSGGDGVTWWTVQLLHAWRKQSSKEWH